MDSLAVLGLLRWIKLVALFMALRPVLDEAGVLVGEGFGGVAAVG